MPGGMGSLGAARDVGVLQDKGMAPQCQEKGPLSAELAVGRGSRKFKYFIMHLL